MQGNLHLCTWNTPCFYDTECYSYSVVTLYSTCNVICDNKPFVLLHYYNSQYVCSAKYGCGSFISCFPCMWLSYFLNDFEKVTAFPIITGTTFFFNSARTVFWNGTVRILTYMFLFHYHGLWIRMFLSDFNCGCHNVITLPSRILSNDFGTSAYQCALSIIIIIIIIIIWASNTV